MLSIRYWIVLLVSTLIVLTVLALSVFSYQEFHEALDERVLLQLTSIKRLKRVQIETYLQKEQIEFAKVARDDSAYSRFHVNEIAGHLSLETSCTEIQLRNIDQGFLDLTSCDSSGVVRLFLIHRSSPDSLIIKEVEFDPIQNILLERSGMGESGETYIVGADFTLRSQSRFLPNKSPGSILARTFGVKEALNGKNGMGQFPDYRGVDVYSAYHSVEVNGIQWIILSELDVAEGLGPLLLLRENLIVISIIVILCAIGLTLLLTTILSKPLLRMRDLLLSMAQGEYKEDISHGTAAKEINEMFLALDQLKQSVSGAIRFSSEIGKMNLTAKHQPMSESDVLGQSLILMREKLIEYEKMEEQNRLLGKRFLIEGQENERERMAKELHDGIGPLLTSLKLALQAAGIPPKEKENLRSMLDKTIEDVRRVTYDLMPLGLKDFGAGRALSAFISQLAKHTEEELIYSYESSAIPRGLDAEVDICVYRIGQELINNGLKHAKASKISLTVTDFEDRVSIFYTDNGIGLIIEDVELQSGLNNMKIRTEVIGGTINFEGSKKGTEIEVEIPLRE